MTLPLSGPHTGLSFNSWRESLRILDPSFLSVAPLATLTKKKGRGSGQYYIKGQTKVTMNPLEESFWARLKPPLRLIRSKPALT